MGTHYESMKPAAFHLQSDFLELRGTVSQWSIELLRIVKVLQSPEMLAKVQVSAPGEGDPPWERSGPPAPQVKATLPGDSSFRLQGRRT